MSYGLVTDLLRALLPFKQLGWKEIDEDFIRFQLFKSRWLNVYLHRLDAPNEHAECHDHPWHFWTAIFINGYREFIRGRWHKRRPLSVLYRPALSLHNTVTEKGKPSWSLIVTSRRVRPWGFKQCE